MKRFLLALLAASGIGGNARAQSQNPVPDLRAMALSVTATELGLPEDVPASEVWGIIMETGLRPSGSYSLVVFADGTTSLYFSTGGGIIGAGVLDPVRAASKRMLAEANEVSQAARPVTRTPVPAAGETIFYFRSSRGTLSFSAPEQDLGEERSRMSSLFHAGHRVITELRLGEESRQTGAVSK